jgi:nicotinamide mononucleotide transporter
VSATVTQGLEVFAVVTGLIYVVLIMRRNRWGFVSGALSSMVYVYISARAHLPMQSLLQAYYVIMGAYGWYSWTRNAEQEEGRIYRWPLRRHLWVALLLLAASALSAQYLARETQAAWPLLDSFTTWTSLLATWMVTRSVLENWLYWICADVIMVYLFLRQGYPYTAGLFCSYMVVSVLGFRGWLQRYRKQAP